MPLEAFLVDAAVIVIPDGLSIVSGPARAVKLRLSLQITPQTPPAGSAGSIALAEWPAKVLEQVASLQLYTAPVAGSQASPAIGSASPLAFQALQLRPPPGAQDFWAATFPDIAKLYAALAALTEDQELTEADAGHSLAIAPRIDVALLGAALLDRRHQRLQDKLGLIAAAGLKSASVAAGGQADQSKRRREMELWAVHGTAEDGTGITRAQVDARASKNRAKVEAVVTLASRDAPWRRFDHSHARLDAIHAAAQLAGKYDEDLARAVHATRPTSPEELLMSRLRSLEDSIVVGPVKEPEDEDKPLLWADERRKFAAIQSFPTVARYLSMIVDIEIDEKDWSGGDYGAIAATFGSQPGPGTCWTAYANLEAKAAAHRMNSGARPRYFGPCDIEEAFARDELPDQEIVRGMLNLRSSDRYSLAIVDAINSVRQEIEHARRAITDGASSEGPLADLSGRGIALIDSGGRDAEVREVSRRSALLQADAPKLQFAGDLVRGFRPSVGVAPRTNPGTYPNSAARWRSLVDRKVTYLHPSLPHFSDQRDREREVGFIQSVTGTQMHHREDETTQTVTLNHEDMFVWTGDSLALAAPGEETPGEVVIPVDKDLPLGVIFSLPPAAPNSSGLPPLREGLGYVVGLSATFVNGCGLTIAQANAAHAASPDLTLGKSRNQNDAIPFPFVRVSRIPSPIVLFPADDEPLVSQPDISDLYGEGLMTMVVRDGAFDHKGKRRRPPRRFFYPERVEFDRAEQQRQFDDIYDPSPSGAFSDNRIDVKRDKERGTFPLAIDGGVIFPGANGEADATRPARGAVLEFLRPHSSSGIKRPYYPDAYTVGLTALPEMRVPSNAAAPRPGSVEFRKPDSLPITALPCLLELRPPRKPLSAGQRIRILVETETVRHVTQPLQKIVIELEKATMVDLQLAPKIDGARFASSHFLRDAFAQTHMFESNDVAATVNILEALLSTVLLEELQGPQTLRLIHAVEKPAVPDFTKRRSPGGQDLPESGIGLVFLTEVAAPPAMPGDPDRTNWRRYVDAHSGKPLNQWPSLPGGSAAFFIGKAVVDGASTGAISCDAHWSEFGPEAVRFNGPSSSAKNQRWDFTPAPRRARMFSIKDLESQLVRRGSVDPSAPSDPRPVTLVDLSRVDTSTLRRLSYSFPDGRARRLYLDLVAVSRFLEYYPRNGSTDTGGDDENRPKTGRAEERTRTSTELWAPCTFRPVPPDVRRISQWFEIRGEIDRYRQIFTFERRGRLRVELGPDGYSSGEDERLALVFNAKPPNDVCAYIEKDELRPYAGVVTRWGGDPLAGTPVPNVEIDPGHFKAPDEPCGEGLTCKPLSLYAGADPVTDQPTNPSVSPIDATVLGYPLSFDHDTGSFYADIGIEPGPFGLPADGYMPFLQLGLARFQPHAVDGHELSFPVGKQVQLLPYRKGTITFKNKNLSSKFKLTLEGPLPASRDHWLELSLMAKPFEADPSWIPASSIDLNKFLSWRLDKPGPNGWQTSDWLDMRLNPRKKHLGLLVEEYEPIETIDRTGAKIKSKRLVFAHLIDFWQDQMVDGRSAALKTV